MVFMQNEKQQQAKLNQQISYPVQTLQVTTLLWKIKLSRTRISRAANNGQQVAGHDDRPNIF